MKNMGMGIGRRKYIDAQQRIETRRYHAQQMCHFQAVSRTNSDTWFSLPAKSRRLMNGPTDPGPYRQI